MPERCLLFRACLVKAHVDWDGQLVAVGIANAGEGFMILICVRPEKSDATCQHIITTPAGFFCLMEKGARVLRMVHWLLGV